MPTTVIRFIGALALAAACLAIVYPATSGARATPPIQWIYVVPTSHWDYGFTDPPQNLAPKIKAHLDDVVAKCESDTRHRYTIESVWMLEEYVAVSTSAQVERLMALVRAGRIALSAAYNGPHSGILSSEELNRWAHRGERLERQYGITARCVHVNDTPGYTWSFPDALAGAGVDHVVCGPNEDFSQPFPLPLAESLFHWQGPAGRRVLTWVSRDGYPEGLQYWNIDANAARLFYASEHPEWQGWSNQQIMEQGITREVDDLAAAGYPYDAALVLMAHDTLNYDASGALLNDIAAWNASHASPQIRLATAAEFFDHILATYGSAAIPVKTGNWTQRWERGKIYGQMAQSRFRELRDGLRGAEWLATVDAQFGAPYPFATLDLAWRDLMRFDDHGAGPSVTGPFGLTLAELNATNLYWMQTSLARRNEVRDIADEAASRLAARVATTPGTDPEVVVFNPVSSVRTDVASAPVPVSGPNFSLVDVASDAPVPFQVRTDGTFEFVAESVPSLGYRRYRIDADSPATWPVRVTAAGTTVESPFYRVTISPTTGAVTSIIDKTSGNRELVNAGSQLAFNRPVKTANAEDYLGAAPVATTTGTPAITVQPGPVWGSLFVEFASPGTNMASPLARVEIRLYDKLKRIDIVDTFDKARLGYTVSANRHSEHFYAPMPFNLSSGSFQARVSSNGVEPLRPPTETYLIGALGLAVNNSHYPTEGVVLRDPLTGYEVQVVSPQAYSYIVGATSNSWTYAPGEATLLPECIVKVDRTFTDDPGFPAHSFVIEPLESNPAQGYSIYTLQFSLTTGTARANVDAARFGGSVMSPLRTASAPGGQTGPLTAAAASFFGTSAPNIEIAAVKPPEFDDPQGVVLRVRETEGIATAATLSSVFRILEARESSLLETVGALVPSRPVAVSLAPFETKTIRLRLGAFAPARSETVGVYVPAGATWFLRNSHAPGPADTQYAYGPAGSAWRPLAGDWDGDGTATAGLYEPVSGTFLLRNANAPGPADVVFGYGPGNAGWVPIVGDWDGNGTDTVGLYEPVSGFFFLRNSNSPGAAELVFGFGPGGAGWRPLAGDWDGDGIDTVGLYDPATGGYFVRNAHAPGVADEVFAFGPAGGSLVPLAGDWNADGVDTAGLYDPALGVFYLRDSHAGGVADHAYFFGPAGSTPITGNWDAQ